MIEVVKLTFNPFEENTYILYDETKDCIIIDPGNSSEQENQGLVEFIKSNDLTPQKIVNTHCHIDHVLGVEFVKNYFNIPFIIPKDEEVAYYSVKAYAAPYGFPMYVESTVDQFSKEYEVVTFGNSSLDVISVPGHSPGHVVLYHPGQKFVIGGDVLFNGSIGRTDLPGGDHEALIKNIQEKLFILPEDVVVHPGHGPETTIGHEKRTNPFLT